MYKVGRVLIAVQIAAIFNYMFLAIDATTCVIYGAFACRTMPEIDKNVKELKQQMLLFCKASDLI